MRPVAAVLIVAAACGTPTRALPDGPPSTGDDAGTDSGLTDGGSTDGDGAIGDASVTPDATPDAMAPVDAMIPVGPITGGPCMSGAAGQTAYRVRWAGGSGASSTAYPVYEVNGLPDHSIDRTGAYGYSIGYTPVYEDVFLAQGGLVLSSSNFVDIQVSTVGLAGIQNATLSIYGRSFNTTASGSFNWQSFDGTGASPTNLVSNAAPYQWYGANMTTEISPGDDGVRLRIKAGPSSGVLVVNRIEICMQAT